MSDVDPIEESVVEAVRQEYRNQTRYWAPELRQEGPHADKLADRIGAIAAQAWVAARFPEPPEKEPMVEIFCGNDHLIATVPASAQGWAICSCGTCGDTVGSVRPAPSAETATPEPHSGMTEAERAFLRLFIRDYLAQVDLPARLVRGADTVAAARRVVQEEP